MPWNTVNQDVRARCNVPQQWVDHVSSKIPQCPDPKRAEREWTLHFNSAFQIPNSALVFPELPFLLKSSPTECLEGRIDLAIFNTETDEWTIIDWKTDEGITLTDLADRYREQLQAYSQALATLTQKPVNAFLYSTCLGNSILI